MNNDIIINNNNDASPPHVNGSASVEPSCSTDPFSQSANSTNNGDDEINTSSFEDLSMNAALGIDSSAYTPLALGLS